MVKMLTWKPAWKPQCQDLKSLMYHLSCLNESPRRPENLSEGEMDFLRNCFAINPYERWMARMIMDNPFVLGFVGVIRRSKSL